MTWAAIVAIIGTFLILLGALSFIMACVADGSNQDFDTKDPELRRQFRYGLVFGITGTLMFFGVVALLTAAAGAG
jgi:hypothetical protein